MRGVLVGRCAAGIRHGFAGADAVRAIGVSRRFSAAGQAGKLAAVLPRQGVLGAVEVGQRVADRDAVFFFVGNTPRRAVDGVAAGVGFARRLPSGTGTRFALSYRVSVPWRSAPRYGRLQSVKSKLAFFRFQNTRV